MGYAKGLLRLNGNPILDVLLDRLQWPGPTLLVTAPGREGPTSSHRFTREVADPIAGQGPLRGVLTALEHSDTGLLIAVTVDMPGISRPNIDWLIKAFLSRPGLLGLMTARRNGDESIVEPFPSAYRAGAKLEIEAKLAIQKRSMHGLLDDARFGRVPAPAEWEQQGAWVNLNTPADIQDYEVLQCRTLPGGKQN